MLPKGGLMGAYQNISEYFDITRKFLAGNETEALDIVLDISNSRL
jgi:hypothetical protein